MRIQLSRISLSLKGRRIGRGRGTKEVERGLIEIGIGTEMEEKVIGRIGKVIGRIGIDPTDLNPMIMLAPERTKKRRKTRKRRRTGRTPQTHDRVTTKVPVVPVYRYIHIRSGTVYVYDSQQGIRSGRYGIGIFNKASGPVDAVLGFSIRHPVDTGTGTIRL